MKSVNLDRVVTILMMALTSWVWFIVVGNPFCHMGTSQYGVAALVRKRAQSPPAVTRDDPMEVEQDKAFSGHRSCTYPEESTRPGTNNAPWSHRHPQASSRLGVSTIGAETHCLEPSTVGPTSHFPLSRSDAGTRHGAKPARRMQRNARLALMLERRDSSSASSCQSQHVDRGLQLPPVVRIGTFTGPSATISGIVGGSRTTSSGTKSTRSGADNGQVAPPPFYKLSREMPTRRLARERGDEHVARLNAAHRYWVSEVHAKGKSAARLAERQMGMMEPLHPILAARRGIDVTLMNLKRVDGCTTGGRYRSNTGRLE
ncbi:unnamed protein product [Amoebophrya sp. A25]|nr:unnamed protein product [Amoebophrya sp. A25]|eukprot:GSA25T00022665001.1